MLIILIGLNGDARQGGVALDVVGLTKHAVTRRKTIVEQMVQIDLATGGREGVEVHIVNMDVAVAVCFGMFGIKDVHFVKLF